MSLNVQSRSDTTDYLLICAGCGLDLTATPKIRRNLGATSKGSSSDVRERVVSLWKELASQIQENLVISYDNLKMCRTCFKDFDNFSVKQAELYKNLRVALGKFNLSERDEASHTEPPSLSKKRPSEDGHPAAKKVVVEQPLVLPGNEPSSPFATVSCFFVVIIYHDINFS